jgi:hypothetical protein
MTHSHTLCAVPHIIGLKHAQFCNTLTNSRSIYNFTVLQFYNFTVLQFYNFTVLQFYNFTVLQFYNFTVFSWNVQNRVFLSFFKQLTVLTATTMSMIIISQEVTTSVTTATEPGHFYQPLWNPLFIHPS